MGRLIKGFGAGLVATVVLSILMIVKAKAGMLAQFNAIAMIADVLDSSIFIGWIGHFVIGTILWGGLFGLFYRRLPRIGAIGKGVVFGILAWLAMMIVFMPLAGAGFFAVQLGVAVVIATFVLHVIYGAVLGACFGAA